MATIDRRTSLLAGAVGVSTTLLAPALPAFASARTDRLRRRLEALRYPSGVHFGVFFHEKRSDTSFGWYADIAFFTTSVVKVDILAALLLKEQRRGRQLYGQIGGAAGVTRANKDFKLDHTVANRRFWLTTTTARNQVRLLGRICGSGQLPQTDQRSYARHLMHHVTGSQDWDVSAARQKGETVRPDHRRRDPRWPAPRAGRMTAPTTPTTWPVVTQAMAHQLAVEQKVCVRPLLRRVIDQETGGEQKVALPCGSTREDVCPSCADRARRLRMQQCAEGWHRADEPETEPTPFDASELDAVDQGEDDDQAQDQDEQEAGDRRVRSTRRRQDAADLPRMPAEDRTVGRAFFTPEGREYRPSMFLTLTMPSYGRVKGNGAPVDPSTYNYRRAALDALHFPKLVDRFWQNLRRCAGYRVQYFAAVEPQKRLAPHLHAAVRGAIPRATLRQVVKATYVQLWWPAFDRPVYVDRFPVWDGTGYCDPVTGQLLSTWDAAVDQAAIDDDHGGRAAHVMRFGSQVDIAGIIAPSEDADRAVRYLTKYLAKSIASTFVDPDEVDPEYERHMDRLWSELRFLPCTPECPNWLRYGVQPKRRVPGLVPGQCESKAHDREHLGLGGRRVLVPRQWSGKTLKQHKADRATVVREALLESGIVAPEIERLAASVTMPDGRPRYVWTDTKTDPVTYARVILETVMHRSEWREQYETAKAMCRTRSATDHDPDG